MEFMRKLMFVCILTAMAALFFQVSDLSLEARSYIQDRLADLGRAPWPH